MVHLNISSSSSSPLSNYQEENVVIWKLYENFILTDNNIEN